MLNPAASWSSLYPRPSRNSGEAKCISTSRSVSVRTDAICANHSADGSGSGLVSTTGTGTGIDMTSQSSRPASSSAGCTTMPASAIKCSILSRRGAVSA
jgi:hypothetical protein